MVAMISEEKLKEGLTKAINAAGHEYAFGKKQAEQSMDHLVLYLVNYLTKADLVHVEPPFDAPCRYCGKPWNTPSCHMGGCPLGADL